MFAHSRKSPGGNKRRIRLLSTGVAMGVADLVPGVSGGTIALLLGIYDELLYSIKLITGKFPKLVLEGKFGHAFRIIPFNFLLPLGIGIVSAIFGLAQLVAFMLDTQPIIVWALFFGLVMGSSWVVSRRVNKWTSRRFLLLVLGFFVTFIVVGLPSVGGNNSILAIFATGAVAITAMILPGISGSLIMVLLGQYEIIISAVTDRNLLTIISFVSGALVGLALFVRLLTWLLKNYHLAVLALLVGVMLGSLRRIWPWQNQASGGDIDYFIPSIGPDVYWAFTLVIAGFLTVLVLERAGVAQEHDDIKTQEFKKEFKEIEGK